MVVTGASSGFGELAALRFARAGARVVIAARRLERLEALAERIASAGGSALPVRCDVTELEELTELRDRVSEAFERCDVLVNNAGIRGGGPFETVDIELPGPRDRREPAGRRARDEAVPPDDAGASTRAHREHRLARGAVRDAGRRRLRCDQARRGRVQRGPVPRARARRHPGDEREPGVLPHRGLPGNGTLVRPAGSRRRREAHRGRRAEGHGARDLDPPVAGRAPGVPRPHPAAVPMGRRHDQPAVTDPPRAERSRDASQARRHTLEMLVERACRQER